MTWFKRLLGVETTDPPKTESSYEDEVVDSGEEMQLVEELSYDDLDGVGVSTNQHGQDMARELWSMNK